MIETPQVLAHYLAAWSETDVTKVREHLDLACAEDVLFVDPNATTRDIDELEKLVIKLRKKRPEVVNRPASGVDGHNSRYRYLWEIYEGDKFLLNGMDVITINEEGKIRQIDGFFGPFPELPKKGIISSE